MSQLKVNQLYRLQTDSLYISQKPNEILGLDCFYNDNDDELISLQSQLVLS